MIGVKSSVDTCTERVKACDNCNCSQDFRGRRTESIQLRHFEVGSQMGEVNFEEYFAEKCGFSILAKEAEDNMAEVSRSYLRIFMYLFFLYFA